MNYVRMSSGDAQTLVGKTIKSVQYVDGYVSLSIEFSDGTDISIDGGGDVDFLTVAERDNDERKSV